jgi:hypothetical protein
MTGILTALVVCFSAPAQDKREAKASAPLTVSATVVHTAEVSACVVKDAVYEDKPVKVVEVNF